MNLTERLPKPAPKDINSYPDLNSIREFYNKIKSRTYSQNEIKQAKKLHRLIRLASV